MLIVESPDKRYKIVSIGTDGWFIYSPPIQSECEGIFISIDDPLVLSLSEELRTDRKELIKSRKATEILLIRLLNSFEVSQKKNNSYVLV